MLNQRKITLLHEFTVRAKHCVNLDRLRVIWSSVDHTSAIVPPILVRAVLE